MTESSLLHPSAFEEDVARALTRRGKILLEAHNLASRVQELEPLETYFLVKELGITDALPILKHATAEQLQTLVDLDCWQEERPNPAALDRWLAAFAADGLHSLACAFTSLDPEVQVLYLADALRVYEPGSPELPPEHPDVPRLLTTDTFFVLDAPGAAQRALHPFALVEALYATDGEEAFRLLTAARWEIPSTLEEMALGFRDGRLEDLGFPPRAEALNIFAAPRLDAAPLKLPPVLNLPAIYAQPLKAGSLLAQALHGVQDVETARALMSDLVYLINAAVVAYGESPQDVSHVSEIAERVRDTVSLGLETLLTHGNTTAAGLLERHGARELFRVGHRETTKLQQEAQALATDPVVSSWLNVPSTEKDDYSQDRLDRELVRALIDARPLYGGFEPLKPERRKSFGSRAELRAAELRLDALAKRLV